MKTQSKNSGFDFNRIKNFVFTMQLCLAMLAFPVLFVVGLTHKYQSENSMEISKQLDNEPQKVVSYTH